MAKFIAVCAWEKFQHYKDRDPPWIKLYRDLLSAESWVLGTDDSRLVQVASMLLAARYRNATPLNFPLFRKVASLDLSESRFFAAIEHLAATGFLEIQGLEDSRKQSASKPLASCTSETEKSREETEQSRYRGARKRATRTCPDDFVITPELSEWAAKNCPGVDVTQETAAFRDYTFANSKTDWVATWRNWMRKAKPAAGRRLTKYEESMNELARRSADGHTAAEPLVGALGPILRPQVSGPVRAVTERGMVCGDGRDNAGSGEVRIPKVG